MKHEPARSIKSFDPWRTLAGIKGIQQCDVETIGPHEAAIILAHNTGNRRVRKAVVDSMASDMVAGLWKLTHQGIAIAHDGRLLDGQHRLHAVIKSGARIATMVFRGCDPDAFDVMDRGIRRTLPDVLNADPRLVEPCAFIARLHLTFGVKEVRPHMAREALHAVGPAVQTMLDVCGSVARGRTAAPVKAAAALRIMQGHREYVLPQWKALVTLDYAAMSPCMQAFCRQITDETRTSPGRRHNGGAMQLDRAARAWVAFDPDRRGINKIIIRDLASVMDEMRAIWAPIGQRG